MTSTTIFDTIKIKEMSFSQNIDFQIAISLQPDGVNL